MSSEATANEPDPVAQESDDEDDDLVIVDESEPPPPVASASSLSTTATQPEIIDVDAEQDETVVFLGSCFFSVVDIQNYDVTAHPGEFVNLIREPNNAHKNAIRVENLRQQQVGYIMKTQADPLALVMDVSRNDLKVDGTIAIRSTGPSSDTPVQDENKLPIFVGLFRRNPKSRKDVVEMASVLQSVLHRVGFVREQNTMPQLQRATRVAEVIDLTQPTMETEVANDWATRQKQLDDMFEKQTREQLSNLPDMEMPNQLYGIQLFDHQVAGIKWMVHRETGKIAPPFYQKVIEHGREVWLSEITHCSQLQEPRQVKGGILADDMGLGKTIQALGLMLLNPPRGYTYPQGQNDSSGRMEDDDRKPAAVTLPQPDNVQRDPMQQKQPSAMNGNSRFHPQGDLIATQNSYPYAVAPGNTSAYSHAPHTHQPHHSTGPICTLIVSPVSVMSNWVQQIDSHVKRGVLGYAIYHGTNRDAVRGQVQAGEIDVLIVSYNTLASDFTKATDEKERGRSIQGAGEPFPTKRKYDSFAVEDSLFDLDFHRVILDEAHLIRNMNTRMFKACRALRSEHRWCLTGTPLQNKPDDINSLFCFLGVEPLGDRDVFRRAISLPIMQGDDTGLARLRAMMAHVALRRSKSLVEELELPGKEIQVCRVSFPDKGFHKEVYDAVFKTARAAFQATISEGGDAAIMKNYMSVLETLLRIRQACCSGILVPRERRERAAAVLCELGMGDVRVVSAEKGKELLDKLKGTFHSPEQYSSDEDEVPECGLCLCEMEESEAVTLRTCSHVFCEPCLARVTSLSANTSCPLCRTTFAKGDMVKQSIARTAATLTSPARHTSLANCNDTENVEASPKIRALLEAIKDMKNDEKGVIFSQFTKFLDAVEPWLSSHGHSFTRIDGSKSATERIEAIKVFSPEESGPRFMLCSLHAAGTGINLTRGSHIYLMDTWWNMAVEHQAFDRCHRIGQRRNVRVVRFIMRKTIEEKMLRIQEAKATMGRGAMEKLDPEEVRRARIGDLKSLFEIGATEDDPIVIE